MYFNQFNQWVFIRNKTPLLLRSLEDEKSVGASYCERLDDLLRRSDFVIIAVKLTPSTTGLLSHRELSLMKPEVTLINISRGAKRNCIYPSRNYPKTLIFCSYFAPSHVLGQVLDQDALISALQTGTIRAAALDVTHPEPLPRSLLRMYCKRWKNIKNV